jgi:hypothetical protein
VLVLVLLPHGAPDEQRHPLPPLPPQHTERFTINDAQRLAITFRVTGGFAGIDRTLTLVDGDAVLEVGQPFSAPPGVPEHTVGTFHRRFSNAELAPLRAALAAAPRRYHYARDWMIVDSFLRSLTIDIDGDTTRFKLDDLCDDAALNELTHQLDVLSAAMMRPAVGRDDAR